MTKQTIQKMMIFALAGWILSSGALAMASAKDPFLTETKQERDERMAWWREARFGMFLQFL